MERNELAQIHAELQRLGDKIDALTELFNRAAYDVGFTRCAAQNNRIEHLESGVELCHNRISAVKKWLVAGLVSVVSLLANLAWNLIHGSLKNS